MTDERPLVAEALSQDPRVLEAQRLLREAVAEHGATLDGPRPSDPARAAAYRAALAQYGERRGGALYYPHLGSGFGRGALVELADGSVKYDMITGIGVHVMGYGHPSLLEAQLGAALSGSVMQGNLEQGTDSAALVERWLGLATEGGATLAHCFLTSSGAMANENALKMMFQKHAPADRVLAFAGCFAGRTLAIAQITDRPLYRKGLPHTLDVDYVPFFRGDDPEGSTSEAVATLRRHIARYPGHHAGMILEMVQGEGGYHSGQREFFLALTDVLKEHGLAVMVDEVQTFGRTSRPFAFQHFRLDDRVDLVTVGKMTQVCATFFTDAYKPEKGLISQTFTSSTAAIRAGAAILTHLVERGCFGERGRNMDVHARFVARLEDIASRHPGTVRGPYGLGGMIAFTALDGGLATTKALLSRLFDAGLIAFLAGSDPCRVRMLPPLGVITDEDIDRVCDILEAELTR